MAGQLNDYASIAFPNFCKNNNGGVDRMTSASFVGDDQVGYGTNAMEVYEEPNREPLAYENLQK